MVKRFVLQMQVGLGSIVLAYAVGCSSTPPPPPTLNVLLEKVDVNQRPLGAKLVVRGSGFTPNGQATVTIVNTNPDGARQAQRVFVDSYGRFSTVFPFQCLSFSKKYAEFDMLANVKDNKTGRFTAASIKSDGFWTCPS